MRTRRVCRALFGLGAGAAIAATFSVPPSVANATTTGAGSVAAVGVGSRTGSASCRISVLPVPPGTWRSEVVAGDPTGRYLVGEAATTGAPTLVPLLWVRGRMADLRPPYRESTFVDVNASGTIVGFATSDTGRRSAWRYRAGRFAALRPLVPGHASYPVAVNGRGEVLGYSVDGVSGASQVVVWPVRGAARTLPAPPGTVAVDLDDDGSAIGVVSTAESSTSYRWPRRGERTVLRGPSGATDLMVFAVRRGWIGGHEFAGGQRHAVAWRVPGGAVNRVPGGLGYAVNRRGDMGLYGAVAHRGGRVVELPLIGLGVAGAAKVLADDGMAAGFANDGSEVHAVVWRGC